MLETANLALIWILGLGVDSTIDLDVLEGIVHQSAITTIVAVFLI